MHKNTQKYQKNQQGVAEILQVPAKPIGRDPKCPKNMQKYYKIFSRNTVSQIFQLNQVGGKICAWCR